MVILYGFMTLYVHWVCYWTLPWCSVWAGNIEMFFHKSIVRIYILLQGTSHIYHFIRAYNSSVSLAVLLLPPFCRIERREWGWEPQTKDPSRSASCSHSGHSDTSENPTIRAWIQELSPAPLLVWTGSFFPASRNHHSLESWRDVASECRSTGTRGEKSGGIARIIRDGGTA